MNPLALEWVAKAEEDFQVLQRECRARKHPGYSAACFHAQQCAEKYLKARLQEAGIAFPRTHSLPALLHLVLPIEPLWAAWNPSLHTLTIYGVNFRYPGATATKADARQALQDCKLVREEARLARIIYTRCRSDCGRS